MDRRLGCVEWEAEGCEEVWGACEDEGVGCVEDVEREEGGDWSAERGRGGWWSWVWTG